MTAASYPGVRLRRFGKWQARITVRGKAVFIGTFRTQAEAIAARKGGGSPVLGEGGKRMSDEGEWGPWIEHDGAEPVLPPQAVLDLEVSSHGDVPAPGVTTSQTRPGWFWRWKTVRVGWFKAVRRRVCDDPAYAPIIRYRIRKPRALLQLIDMVENRPAPTPGKVDA